MPNPHSRLRSNWHTREAIWSGAGKCVKAEPQIIY